MIEDPYLLLYLSSFLTVRDFINLSRTSRLFTDDPLILGEVHSRIHNSISLQFTSVVNEKTYSENTTIHNLPDSTWLVFNITPTPMLEIIQDVPSERLIFHIKTPQWSFSWSGVLFNNDICRVSNTAHLIHVANNLYASIDIIVHHDSDVVFLDEIRFRMIHNIPKKMQEERRRNTVSAILFALSTIYVVVGANELIIRIELFIYMFVIVYYVNRDYVTQANLFPIYTE
jgi:hypothetical protein